MAFVPENDLERAIVEAAINPATLGRLYSLLLDSELFVLGRAGEGKIDIAQIHHHDRIYHPLFSAPIRMQGFAKEHPKYFSMKGRDLFASARGAYFLLNPGWDYVTEITPQNIARAFQAEKPADAPPSGKVLITQPAVYPTELANALRNLFATRPDVEAAYLGQITVGGGVPSSIVGVKCAGAWAPVSDAIRDTIAALPQGTRLVTVPISDQPPFKAMAEALMVYEPLYVRKFQMH